MEYFRKKALTKTASQSVKDESKRPRKGKITFEQRLQLLVERGLNNVFLVDINIERSKKRSEGRR